MEEVTRKQEEQKKRVQDQLVALKQLLEATSLEKESRIKERPSSIPMKEAESAIHS
jgi:hypothetical protein